MSKEMEAEEIVVQELVNLRSPAPLSFSVAEYVEYVKEIGYKNDVFNFDFNRLLEDIPRARKAYSIFANDMQGKAILSHCYGERLAKSFRDWIYTQIDESTLLPDAGAGIGEDEEGLMPC